MDNKTYGLGGVVLGAWVGKAQVDNEQQRFIRLNIFPFSIMFIINNVSSCFRIHILNYIKLSLTIEID
jgi:hypothetical protein|tara:strand:+ start:111 stop:314 length:204 start_codon:yes stop_codon:yes gene_type:complete